MVARAPSLTKLAIVQPYVAQYQRSFFELGGAREHHAATCLSLPVAPHLTDVEVDRVIDAVQSFRPPG